MSREKERAADILVPVYNGYEDLQKCVESLKRHTDLRRHRLFLIDDCSTDGRIRPYLDALAGEGISVSHNETNLGFSGSVNLGMELAAPNDVLLLNSDTVVTKNWMEKIMACAYSDEAIGTVTPLSNSATLCSVPVMCRDNEVPDSLSIDEYAALIERCSLKRYPRITVAVGFCMYIRRSLIDDIGMFDAQTFGRGYGEENDFCCRAEQAGYCHVMCDDTFIYHKGTASFDTEQKRALVEAHTAVLEERYPLQMRKNRLYCMENPDQDIRDNIALYTGLHNGKKNLLYCLHFDFREHAFNNIGGTQIHVRELTEELLGEYNVFVLARDGDYLCLTAYTEKEPALLKFEIGRPPQFPVFRDQRLRRIYEQILLAFQIDLVHVHHTQDLSLEIYYAAERLHIPVFATLHDYYYVCPTILLLDAEGKFCAGEERDGAEEKPDAGRSGADGCGGRCRDCLRQKKGIAPQTDFLRIWRRENERALRLCRKLIFPSGSARDIFLRYFPQLADAGRCMVIEHGEDKLEREICHVPAPQTAEESAELKVRLDCVAGMDQVLNVLKGWAHLKGVPGEETQVYVEFTDSAGAKDCFLARKTARPDIVEAFGDPDALLCGIDLQVDSEVLAEGPVKIQVFVTHNGRCYTDGKRVSGYYRRRYGGENRLNVAFLGGMVPQKGSRMAKQLIERERDGVNWFVMGAVGDKEILELRQENCFFSSTYCREDLSRLLRDNRIDVACIVPVWPETFCYTVSEAWMNGIPVIGTDIGAVGERIRATGAGWLVKPDAEPGEILELLRKIKDDPDELARKKQVAAAYKGKRVADMCREYRTLYAQTLTETGSRSERTEEADFDFIFQAYALGTPSVCGRTGSALLNRMRQENEILKASLAMMQDTTSYRLARRIADLNLPFKEQLKTRVRKLRDRKNIKGGRTND